MADIDQISPGLTRRGEVHLARGLLSWEGKIFLSGTAGLLSFFFFCETYFPSLLLPNHQLPPKPCKKILFASGQPSKYGQFVLCEGIGTDRGTAGPFLKSKGAILSVFAGFGHLTAYEMQDIPPQG